MISLQAAAPLMSVPRNAQQLAFKKSPVVVAGSSGIRSVSVRSARRHGVITRAAIADPPAKGSVKTIQRPDASGRFGKYGGKYVPETLIAALEELESTYRTISKDPAFKVRLAYPSCRGGAREPVCTGCVDDTS